jgi:hypothetical protein
MDIKQMLTLPNLVLGVLILDGSFWGTLALLDAYSPSPTLEKRVRYQVEVREKQEVCAAGPSTIIFEGNICKVRGSTVSVAWHALSNMNVTHPPCGADKTIRWEEKGHDPAWISKYLGSCGRSPSYFEQMPSEFAAQSLMFD